MKFLQIFTALMFLVSAVPTWAQSQSTFKRTTATILFSSIGGGILGLSTLSFYGKPQEHTDNITNGVLIGLIAGVSYVLYDNYDQRSAANDNRLPQKLQQQALFQASDPSTNKKRGPDLSWPLLSFQYQW
ncbi:MAG: hypothetical protein B7Y39_00400 [Bdellovibrio sp. 28-41-41]|nr:MAG: hypothetical protein B7Y39_00400 [Bdellovibrio sp. 28-41-41]